MYIVIAQTTKRCHPTKNFITLSANPWRKLRANIQHAEFGKKIELVENRKYFHLTRKNKDVYRTLTVRSQSIDTCIHLNLSEWLEIINLLKYVDKIIYPNPTISCRACKNEIQSTNLYSGRLRPSQLSQHEVNKIKLNNNSVYNQMGLICEHCGITSEYECHCHLIICQECSPECFCEQCKSCLYYFYQQ